jgi:hypothetical protein
MTALVPVQNLRSGIASKRPVASGLAFGQIAVNYNADDPAVYLRGDGNELIKVAPTYVSSGAPNAVPASGGASGNSLGESWLDTSSTNALLKIWDGNDWQIAQPVASGTVVSTTDSGTVTSTMIADGTIVNADVNSSAAIAGTKVSPSFGDQDIVTTGNLTLNAQGDLRFGDSDSSNYVAFQAPATVASDVTWTLPDADGTANQVLSTNGSGTLSWATGGGGGTKIEVGNTSAEVVDTGSDGHFKVTTEGSERMRIRADGRIGINTSDFVNGRFIVESDGSSVTNTVFIEAAAGVESVNTVGFKRGGGFVGTISTTSTATAYNTSSDYRLKENVVPLAGAIDRLQQIPVHRFNFIADPDNTVDGFLAHEAQEIVPECVTGTKDEVDADGNPVYQGIDQSKLVPLLTAALQEAIGRIETLEAEVTALKAQ